MSSVSGLSVSLGMMVAVITSATFRYPTWVLKPLAECRLTRGWLPLRPPTFQSPQAVKVQEEAVRRRVAIKYRVVCQVIQGERTLIEAAACFRQCGELYDSLAGGSSSNSPRAEEDFCKSVVSWVRGEMNIRDPSETDEVMCRLEEELRRHRELNGKIVLPANPPLPSDQNWGMLPASPPAGDRASVGWGAGLQPRFF
jgi:hypothetical protein